MTFTLDPVDFWRLGNVALAAVALVLLVREMRPSFRTLGMRMALIVQATAVLMLEAAVAAMENLAADNPLGVRVPLATAGAVWVIAALLFTDRELPHGRS